MKKPIVPYIVLLVFSLSNLNAQRGKSIQETPQSISAITAEDIAPFSKGSLKFGLSSPLDIAIGSNKYDGEKQSNFTNFNLRGMGTYFVADGFGAGAGLSIDKDKTKNENDYTNTESEFIFTVHGVYGTEIEGVNTYIQPSIGFGRYKSEDKYNNITNEYKEGIFRAGIKVGALIPIGENTNTYFNPKVGWRLTKYTESDNSSNFTSTSKFFVGAGISVIIPTRDIPCDCNTDFANVSERFSEGRNILEYSNKFKFSGYSYKEEYDPEFGEPYKDEDSETDFDLDISYKRAIADRLFVGGFLNTSFEKYDYEEDPEYLYKYSYFMIGPAVEFHPLQEAKLENFFVEANLGAGISKSKTEDGNTTTENSYSRFSMDLSAAYDYGITSNISLVPRFGYQYGQWKNKDSDIKSSTSNVYLGFSTRINFAGF